MMLKKLLVLLCGIAMIIAAGVFSAPLWAYTPGLIVFFCGLIWIGVWDAKADGSGRNYWGGGS
jgi:hypothetical protein